MAYVFRRDSDITDSAHMAAVAKASTMFMRQLSIQEVEQEQKHLSPKVDGRIIQVDREVYVCKLLCTYIRNKN